MPLLTAPSFITLCCWFAHYALHASGLPHPPVASAIHSIFLSTCVCGGISTRLLALCQTTIWSFISPIFLLYLDQFILGGALHLSVWLDFCNGLRTTIDQVRLAQCIYILSNRNLSGELEGSMHSSFLRAANLRRWLGRDDCPDAVREMQALFHRFYDVKSAADDHITELMATDMEDGKTHTFTNAPVDLAPLVRSRRVALRARYKAHQVIYARAHTHLGNSHVLFRPGGRSSVTPVPAKIRYIYMDEHEQVTRFAVQRYHASRLPGLDLFAQWLDFPARLWSTHTNDLESIQIEWVSSHFASWKFTEDLHVVLSLDRVSAFAPEIRKDTYTLSVLISFLFILSS
jgi:hypothetical protein